MKAPQCQFELLETSLEGLRVRQAEAPITGILICRLLQQIGRSLAELLEQRLRPFGLAEAEFRVLMALFAQPEGVSHPGDLCLRTSQRPANMSRICDALVHRGLITRVSSAHDRRRLVLRITPAGEELVERLLPPLFAPLREIFADVPTREQEQLIRQLRRLGLELDAVRARQEPAA